MLGRVGMRRLGASISAMLLSLITAGIAQAQGAATITGTVTSEAGQALYGANVTIEVLAISVGTGEDGKYTITIPGAVGQQVCKDAIDPLGGGTAEAPVINITVIPACPKP